MTRKQFRKTIKDWRERKGLTQADAARKLGISIRTLQNWEIARNMPRGFGLSALVKVIAVVLCLAALTPAAQALDYLKRWRGIDGYVYLNASGKLITTDGNVYFPLKKRNKNQPDWAELGWHGYIGFIYLDSRTGELVVWGHGTRFVPDD